MILDEVAAYLQAQSLGEVGVSIFAGAFPDTPDVCLCVQSRPGLPTLPVHGNLINLEQPRISVVARGVKDDFAGPQLAANNVFKALALVLNQALSGVTYLKIQPSSPYPTGRDSNGRFLVSVTAEVIKNPS